MVIQANQGSATSARPSGDTGVIIAHLNNHLGRWGRGFVLAVDELSPAPKVAYKHYAKVHNNDLPLGETQLIEIEPGLFVANMIAQKGIDRSQTTCLVDYNALKTCLTTVFLRAVLLRCNVHIPDGIGSGLAGGDKKTITDIIAEVASDKRIVDMEQHMGFVPTITLWEFTDTSARSFVPSANATAAVTVGQIDLDEVFDDGSSSGF